MKINLVIMEQFFRKTSTKDVNIVSNNENHAYEKIKKATLFGVIQPKFSLIVFLTGTLQQKKTIVLIHIIPL